MAPSQLGKRKQSFPSLQRRVRARKDDSESENNDFSDSADQDSGSDIEELHNGNEIGSSDPDAGEDDDDDDEFSDEEVEKPLSLAASQISFGALAKAQASLPGAKQRRNEKKGKPAKPSDKDNDSDNDDDDDDQKDRHSKRDSKPSAASLREKLKRSSKHAPMEQSSKRQVTRRREVVSSDGPKALEARDPRFSAAGGGAIHGGKGRKMNSATETADEARARRNYAFLDDYRESEMAEMRAAVAASKPGKLVGKDKKSARKKNPLAAQLTPEAREAMKKQLASMESRRDARKRQDSAAELVREHRRKERELVASTGKKPFYLKKSEQKKQLLEDRFKSMKGRDVDKAIAKKRKKLAGKEKKNMPMERRRMGAE